MNLQLRQPQSRLTQGIAKLIQHRKSKREREALPLEYNLKFVKYLGEIEDITGVKISPKQKALIKLHLEKKKYIKLNANQSKENRRRYTKKRKELIAEWEKQTGNKWGTYKKPIYSKKGKIVRQVGATYDAHHIILCSWGGEPEWWNVFPAMFPNEHQQGIHRKGGLCQKIFGKGE